jgi:hypothetical protein
MQKALTQGTQREGRGRKEYPFCPVRLRICRQLSCGLRPALWRRARGKMWRETCPGIPIPGIFPRAQRHNAAARSVAQESCRQMRSLVPNRGDFLCVLSGLGALRVVLFFDSRFCPLPDYRSLAHCLNCKIRTVCFLGRIVCVMMI